jgi:hypothetical protein
MAVAAANGSCSRGIEGLDCVHRGSSWFALSNL